MSVPFAFLRESMECSFPPIIALLNRTDAVVTGSLPVVLVLPGNLFALEVMGNE